MAARLRAGKAVRVALTGIPPACLVCVLFVLRWWADEAVRQSWVYIFLLTGLGAAWLGAATYCFMWLGVSLRDDALEGNNLAAAMAWAGAMLGVACAYAGGNIGAGPSLWNNLFLASLASIALAALWLMLELGCKISLAIALERDVASGVRAGGFLVAAGLIVGRAVAGDWHSTASTLFDFVRDAWPASLLAGAALFGEHALRPSREQISLKNVSTHGLAPAVVYVIFASLWLAHLGHWEDRR